jgi:uncharacterized protein YbbC (DUF1343 family)
VGEEVLINDRMDLLKGKRVGLITNPTGVDRSLTSIVDTFYHNKNFQLTALFGPEHGVRGSEEAGAYVPFYIDKKTQLPAYSLYGETKKLTGYAEKCRCPSFLISRMWGQDSILSSIQWPMKCRLQKKTIFLSLCWTAQIRLAKQRSKGPVLDPKYSSFVGMYPIALRHGVTVGELAEYFNQECHIEADLTVVKMKGWKRNEYYDETPLQWVMPSPNMPTLDTALVYPGTALLEGTNVSEGRGTTRPFELIGAPFIDGDILSQKLKELKLPGVVFRSAYFTPTTSKFTGELSGGIQIHVTDRDAYQPVETGTAIVKTIHDLYPDQFAFLSENKNGISYFDELIGNGWVRKAINDGSSLSEIVKRWNGETSKFKQGCFRIDCCFSYNE